MVISSLLLCSPFPAYKIVIYLYASWAIALPLLNKIAIAPTMPPI
ncbi:hypothetical protein [Nostoc sp. NOS(2021)]|nr:hypothetical protein [Nostoc sp. NOS(2021)]